MASKCIKIQGSEDFKKGILPYTQATRDLIYDILAADFRNGWPVPEKKYRIMDSGDLFFYHVLSVPLGTDRDSVRMCISVVKNPLQLASRNNFYQDYDLAFLNKFTIR